MSRRRFGNVDTLIHDLLDRHEANPGATRLLAYIDEEAFSTVEARDRFTRALLAAEQTGGIAVQRRRVDGSILLGHVRLVDPAPLYAQLQRVPAQDSVENALEAIRAREDLSAAAHAVIDEIAEAWSRGVGRFGLAPRDETGLADALALVRLLAGRAADGDAVPLDFRTFSRAAGTDSKALERVTSTVVRIFERLHPASVPAGALDADDVLASFGVLRTPQPLVLSGPIAVAGATLPPLRFYGVPPEQGDLLSLAGDIDYLLTIENYASFIRHVREINADRSALVIYTGGFPSRGHLRQIVRLARAARVPSYHWGDLDGGGVRIFRYLEQAVGSHGLALRPHLMDPVLLELHGVPSDKQLRAADAPPHESAIRSLWDILVSSNMQLEQESLAPRHPQSGQP
ncbi:Wadjet anti-phage system protein JetD domain-containing protein [Sphingomonas sp. OTU376]|uniref:Wadjet anti-phage system protein JetD domain-containing protein n=1 Tax=Sphingomonas sp. OTU376 TaxID=3043863 RepID=UPI00313B5BBE